MRVYSHDLTDAHVVRMRDDLTKARELGGATTSLLFLEGRFALAVSRDRARALEFMEAAESLGALNPIGLNFKAGLMHNGRPDEAITLLSRAGDLDPTNTETFRFLTRCYWDLRRPAEAFQVLRAFNERNQTKLPKGDLVFAFTGQTEELARDVSKLSPEIDEGQRLQMQLHLARAQKRSSDLIAIVDRSSVKELRPLDWSGFPVPLVGHKPVAELYGWAKLLTGDRAGAVSDGRTMLKFVDRQPVTPTNDWYLRLLAAEGWLFSGDISRAVAETRSALARTGTGTNFTTSHYRRTAAMIFAWAGEENDAVALLERLATEFPSAGPAEITRDPLYSTPLANSLRYQALAKKLEAEIAENQKLLVESAK